jgi:hypothetical protein
LPRRNMPMNFSCRLETRSKCPVAITTKVFVHVNFSVQRNHSL